MVRKRVYKRVENKSRDKELLVEDGKLTVWGEIRCCCVVYWICFIVIDSPFIGIKCKVCNTAKLSRCIIGLKNSVHYIYIGIVWFVEKKREKCFEHWNSVWFSKIQQMIGFVLLKNVTVSETIRWTYKQRLMTMLLFFDIQVLAFTFYFYIPNKHTK